MQLGQWRRKKKKALNCRITSQNNISNSNLASLVRGWKEISLKKPDKQITELSQFIPPSNIAPLMGSLSVGEGWRTGYHPLDNNLNPLLNEKFNPRSGQEWGRSIYQAVLCQPTSTNPAGHQLARGQHLAPFGPSHEYIQMLKVIS